MDGNMGRANWPVSPLGLKGFVAEKSRIIFFQGTLGSTRKEPIVKPSKVYMNQLNKKQQKTGAPSKIWTYQEYLGIEIYLSKMDIP